MFRRARTANSNVCGQNWPKSKLIQDIMHFLVKCKFKKGRNYSNREKVETLIFRCPRAANSIVTCRIPPKVLVIPRKRWLRPNMSEKLFTGTLRINQPTNQLVGSGRNSTSSKPLFKYDYKDHSESTSRKHLRTKVTSDFHLTYSKNGEKLGSES